MSLSTPCLPAMTPIYVYDGPASTSATPHCLASVSLESILPPAYTERGDAATITHSICSPPYSPRPLPRPPTSTAASVAAPSPVHSPRTASPVIPYNDDLTDPVLPPVLDDDRSFVPSDSDSESDADSELDSDSEDTLHEDALIQLAVAAVVRPALHLPTHKVLDSTLSPVDPECLSKLDTDLLLTPLNAWADVCYTASVSSDSDAESEPEDEPRCAAGARVRADDRPWSRASQHAFASSERAQRPARDARHRPSASDGTLSRSAEPPTPFLPTGCKIAPRTLRSPPLPHASRLPPPTSSSRSPSPSMSRPALLAAPRPRRGILSLSTIRSQSPPTSDSDASDSDCAPAPARDARNKSGPPGWAAWLPVADVEERVAALHVDFGRAPDLALARAEREKGERDALTRPTSPVPGYPLLWSREPPNPADSVGGFPRREEVRAEGKRTRRGESLSRRVVGLFR